MHLVARSIFVCAVVIALSTTVALARPDVVLHLSGATVTKAPSGAEKLAPLVHSLAQPGDFVVLLGAGTITQWAYALPGELAALDRH